MLPAVRTTFQPGFDTEDEVFQNLTGVAFYLGAAGTGTSEWEYVRIKFVGPMLVVFSSPMPIH